jgi:hypothetical protein
LKGKAKTKRFHENPLAGEHMALVSLAPDARQHVVALSAVRM